MNEHEDITPEMIVIGLALGLSLLGAIVRLI